MQAAEIKLGDLAADKKDALSEVLKLKASLTTAQTEAKQKLAAMGELKQTKLQLDKTVKTLAEVQAAKSTQDKALLTANDEAADAVAKADTARTALQEAEQKINALTAASDTSSKELAALKNELQTAASKVVSLGAGRKAAEAEAAAIKDQLAAVSRESERREADVTGIVEAFQLERKAAADDLAKAEILVKDKDEALRKASAIAKKSALEAQIVGEKLIVKQRELEQNKVDVDAALADLANTRDQISQRVEKLIELAVAAPKAEFAELQKKLRAVEKENARLKAKLSKKSAKAAQ